MKKFLLKVVLFIFPIALICIPAFLHLRGLGELMPLSDTVRENQEKGALVGFAYSDPGYLLKHQVIQRRSPEVIALGTSRALQIRSSYFLNPGSFYNCGRSIARIKDLRSFLNSYSAKSPKVILLSLDQDFFNENYDDFSREPRLFLGRELSTEGKYLKALKGLVKVVRKGEFKNPEAQVSRNIGGLARWYQSGFRSDGSYCYGQIFSVENDYQFTRTLERITKNSRRFSVADKVHSKAVEELKFFLENCQEKGIHVTAFLPPYAKKVYSVLKESEDLYPYVFRLFQELDPVFKNYEMTLFDFGDMSEFGSNDFETIDGFHGSEICYLRMMKVMSQGDPVLAKFFDETKADDLLKNAHSSRQLINEVEEESPQVIVSIP